MSNSVNQFDYIQQEISARINRLDQSVVWYRKTHFRGQMAVVVLSAAITILSGLKSLHMLGDVLSDAVLVLGALLSVVSTWGAFFSPKESWHLNAATYGRLRALQARLEFRACDPNFGQYEEKVVAETFDEYQRILTEFNDEWRSLRGKSK